MTAQEAGTRSDSGLRPVRAPQLQYSSRSAGARVRLTSGESPVRAWAPCAVPSIIPHAAAAVVLHLQLLHPQPAGGACRHTAPSTRRRPPAGVRAPAARPTRAPPATRRPADACGPPAAVVGGVQGVGNPEAFVTAVTTPPRATAHSPTPRLCMPTALTPGPSPHRRAQAHSGQPMRPATAAAPPRERMPLAITARTQGGAGAKNCAFQAAPLACSTPRRVRWVGRGVEGAGRGCGDCTPSQRAACNEVPRPRGCTRCARRLPAL